jgi:hypothetical protein
VRRPIRELILRELSFSGQAMTAAQIAKAINYIPERTETALERISATARVMDEDIHVTPQVHYPPAMPMLFHRTSLCSPPNPYHLF